MKLNNLTQENIQFDSYLLSAYKLIWTMKLITEMD